MAFEIVHYNKENPMMRITLFDRNIEFSVASVPPEKHSWLGHVLEKQITELVEIQVKQAIFNQQQQLRQLCGIR